MKDVTNSPDELADTPKPDPENGIAATVSFVRPAAPAPPPEVIGRYKVTGRIGAGAFGVVYKAVDEQLQREVAIKIVRPPKEEEANADTLLSEARLMARLSHPAIVPVFDVGQLDDGSVFIVSKLIEGQDLSRLMKSQRLPHGQSAELVAQIADALDYAHVRGVVHRDVKPKNILINADGTPVLADFGLALQQSEFGRGARFAGTPAYMSPEQARLEGHRVDGRSDVYSVGTVLYELLTGARPFEADSVDDLLDCIRTIEVRPPRQIDRRIPRELERICLKALAKRPADRYSTAGDLAEDLRHWYSAAEATAGSTSPAIGDKRQGGDSSKSDRANIVVLPRGLRPFEAVDADFFLELLPGARDRNGLPESVRFWKSRIEETDVETTFRAGLLLGPSGSGKSSLVRAGIVPHLGEQIVVIVIDARPDNLADRLLIRLKSRLPALSGADSLAEALHLARQRRVLPAGRKLLLVIDQFEQWLSGHNATSRVELIEALRQCDGVTSQVLFLVRDDFTLAATRFMEELEEPLLQNRNFATLDLFGVDHARRVLAAFGKSFGAVAERPTREQERFLDLAVHELASSGRVAPIQLAVFAEMMKDKPWTASMLRNFGGMLGVGLAFLDDRLAGANAHPDLQSNQRLVHQILAALLPEVDSEIKGRSKTRRELAESLDGQKQDSVVDRLLGLLDTEVRLITPAGGGHAAAGDSASVDREPSYQLAHDYLVPVLREWLTADERRTHAGRTRMRLRELAEAWNKQPEPRRLPTGLQWLNIRCFTRPRQWSEGERRMMRTADRRMLISLTAVALCAAMLWLVGREWHGRVQGVHLRDRVLGADTAEMPVIARQVGSYQRWALPRIEEAAAELSAAPQGETPEQSGRRRMNLALILAQRHPDHVEYLLDRLPQLSPQQLSAIAQIVPASQVQSQLWKRFERQLAQSDGSALPGGALLAQLAPSDDRWQPRLQAVTRQLASSRPAQITEWVALYAPLGERLVPHLLEMLKDEKARSGIQMSNAVEALARYGAKKPEILAEALGNVGPADFETLAKALSSLGRSAPTAVRKQLTEFSRSPRQAVTRGDSPDAEIVALIERYEGYLDDAGGLVQSAPLKDFSALVQSLAAQGYRPVSIRPYARAGDISVAAAWKHDSRRFAMEFVDSAEKLVEINRRHELAGMSIVDMACYPKGDSTGQEPVWAGLWEEAAQADGATASSKRFYVDIPLIDHHRRDSEWSDSGFSIERFEVRIDGRGEARCSAIWRQTGLINPTAQLLVRYLRGFGDLAPGNTQTDCRFAWLDPRQPDRWVFCDQLSKSTEDAEGTASQQVALAKWMSVVKYDIAAGDFDKAAAILEANREKLTRAPLFFEHSAQLHARRGDLAALRNDITSYARFTTTRRPGMLEYLRLRAAILSGEPLEEPLRLLQEAFERTKTVKQKADLQELLVHAEAAMAAANPEDTALRAKVIQSLRDHAQTQDGPLALIVFDRDLDRLRDAPEFAKLLEEFQLQQRYCVAYGHHPDEESRQLYGLSPAEHLRSSAALRQVGFLPHCVTVQMDSATGKTEACSVWRRPAPSPEQEVRVAQRRANLAMALAYFGEFDAVQDFLQDAGGLDCRAWIVGHAAELLPPESFIQALRASPPGGDSSRLLRLLGGYPKSRFSADDQAYLSARVSALAGNSASAAVKSAASWCLTQWQINSSAPDSPASAYSGPERNWFVNSLGQTMIVIPRGETFLMGSPPSEAGRDDSERRHWVHIDRSFAIAATETTQGQFRDFLADERIKRLYASERHQPALALDPQEARPEAVSWLDAARFCQWLSERENLPESEWCYPGVFTATDTLALPTDYLQRTGYRLPREMEWEYAARAGSTQSRHCGAADDLLGGYEWFMPHSSGRVHRVATLRPNDLGFFDMLGNAVEWCDDLQGPYRRPLDLFFREDTPGNDQFPKAMDKCVIRGGSALSLAEKLRAANRSYQWIDYHTPTTGFRVARTLRP
jgi:serine/threonine protein kinase/formylglycine-generating enzyme required for sulfatase activity